MVCGLSSHTDLARFRVTGIYSLLLTGPKVQLNSCWLPPGCKSHYCTTETLLVGQSYWLVAGWGYWLLFPLGSPHRTCQFVELVRRRLQVRSSSCGIVLSNRILSSNSGSYQGPWQQLKQFRESLRFQQLKGRILLPGSGISC